VIPGWTFPRTAGIFGGNISTDEATQSARLSKWAAHDMAILYPGAFRVLPDVDERLRVLNPGIEVSTYFQGMRRCEVDSIYRPNPRGVTLLPEVDGQGWPGWDAMDLRLNLTVERVIESYTEWQVGEYAGTRPYFFDELHADVTFERPEITGQAWYEGARKLLRKMGGGIVNGNFGRVTPNTPDGSWTPMIHGRMVQNAGDLTGAALFAEAKLLVEEAAMTSPERRWFIIQDTRPEHALKCLVLSLFCDGYYGISRHDFRQDTLIEAAVRRGALGRPVEYANGLLAVRRGDLGRPVEYANGLSQVPDVKTNYSVSRYFERGWAWVGETGDFGVVMT